MNIVLVVGSREFDDCARVHSVLDKAHAKKTITHIVHEGYSAGAFASAWARVNAGVIEVAMPALLHRRLKTPMKAKAAAIFDLLEVKNVVTFGVDKENWFILDEAQRHGVKIRPFDTEAKSKKARKGKKR